MMSVSNKIGTNVAYFEPYMYVKGLSRNGVGVEGWWTLIQYTEWNKTGAPQLYFAAKIPSQNETSDGYHLHTWLTHR
jgi:hypothetical protein